MTQSKDVDVRLDEAVLLHQVLHALALAEVVAQQASAPPPYCPGHLLNNEQSGLTNVILEFKVS